MNALRNFLQTFRAVIARVKRRHVCQQRLRGADVARGFFAADVLLARAEREAQRGFAASILGDAYNATGHLALEFVTRGEERGVRAAVAQRHTEALRAADRDVRAEFAGRLDVREREQIGGDRDHRAGGMCFFREAGEIVDRAEGVGILHERAEDFFGEGKCFVVANDDFDCQCLGAGAYDLDCLRMAVLRHKKNVSPVLQTVRHRHRFGGGGRLVQH